MKIEKITNMSLKISILFSQECPCVNSTPRPPTPTCINRTKVSHAWANMNVFQKPGLSGADSQAIFSNNWMLLIIQVQKNVYVGREGQRECQFLDFTCSINMKTYLL